MIMPKLKITYRLALARAQQLISMRLVVEFIAGQAVTFGASINAEGTVYICEPKTNDVFMYYKDGTKRWIKHDFYEGKEI